MNNIDNCPKMREYRGFGKKVYQYIKSSPVKVIKKDDMAKTLRCCTRTIARWTAIMEKEKVLAKIVKAKNLALEYTILI